MKTLDQIIHQKIYSLIQFRMKAMIGFRSNTTFAIFFILVNKTLSETPPGECIDKLLRSSNPDLIFLIFLVLLPLPLLFIFLRCKDKCTPTMLKKKFNKVDTKSMSKEQFERKQKMVYSAFENSNQRSSAFLYYYQKNPNTISIEMVTIRNEEKQFYRQINLDGVDRIGAWQAIGYILCKQGNIFFWMIKEYTDKISARQIGGWRYLIYESTSFHDQLGMMGNWYYKGHRHDIRYHGRWQLYFNKKAEIKFDKQEYKNEHNEKKGREKNVHKIRRRTTKQLRKELIQIQMAQK